MTDKYAALRSPEVQAALSIDVAIQTAELADKTFSETCKAAGYKSRWDVSVAVRNASPKILAAYDAKVKADFAVSQAFHAAGRTKAGNEIGGL